MKKQKRFMALITSLVLFFSILTPAIYAAEPPEGMINISSDWQGSVFGNLGGNDKVSSEFFHITENEDDSVTIKSSENKGKIDSNSEGLAYYFKEVDPAVNYELSATAHVDQWEANNQVSFGIMLRSNVLENENDGSFNGDFVSVGAIDQAIEGFYRRGGSLTKSGFEFTDANAPAPEETYHLSVKKSGNIYTIKVGDETKIIEDFTGEIAYAGLYSVRNTTVTYSDVNLTIEGQIELGDWEFSAFGSNTSTTSDPVRNPDPTVHEDGSVTLLANGGKISSSADGISYYYKEVPGDANFEITTKAAVKSFTDNNQVSFGLMLRDQVGVHGEGDGHEANYILVGGLDKVMKAAYKQDSQKKVDVFDVNAPAPDEVYDLKIKKSGDTYVLSVNDQSEQIITLENLFSDTLFAGLYVARGAEVTFSDFDIQVDTRVVKQLRVDKLPAQTKYLLNESLNLDGLEVTAIYSDESEEKLLKDDMIVTGFDNSVTGTNKITLNYNGASASVDLEIVPLTVTALKIMYFPAKTVYYQGDVFDPEGFTVNAEYNNGYVTKVLAEDQYTFSIADAEEKDGKFILNNSGTNTVKVNSTETPETTTSFDISVKDAKITTLEIRQLPEKKLYFIGDELDIDGMVIYAKYSDSNEVRLLRDEYQVAPFDTSTDGEKTITISHKGVTVDLLLKVKAKELSGIEVTGYPQTTYTIGEDFDHTGLIVSKVYDNGDKETMVEDDFTINASDFDNTTVGIYDIHLVPVDTSISAIAFKTTVRESPEAKWNTIQFGQSTSDSKNVITVHENGSVKLEALEGGGKVTGDHDGISYYYTVIDAEEDNFELSADIKVIEYAKTKHDGQESFGLMARDAIGTNDDSSVFASNIAAVGGYSGGTKNDNGTQLFVRTGVESSDGAGSQGVNKIMLNNVRPAADNTYPAAEYRLTLSKTNSGYTGKFNNGQEEIIFEPDILNIQDSKIYVGFYTARFAAIEVSGIEFKVTASATDAPKIKPPLEPVVPALEVVSLDKTSETAYDLMLKSNVNGTVTVKQGENVISTHTAVETGEILSIQAVLAEHSNTNFSITFLPGDTQYLTSYDKLVQNFTVISKTYASGGNIYVSPTGSSSGSGVMSDPLDLDTAIEFVQPGQKIIVMEGRYVRDTFINIKKYNDGTAEAKKYLIAAPGTKPIIDFDKKSEGVVLSGNYWHVKGLDFTKSAGNTKGFTIGGHHNIVEDSRFYENGDTGLQISRTDITENDKSKWPSYNLILNSTSFDNRDPSDNNADGFAAKLTSGEGNIFRGAVAHNNIDDGWDLYTKAGAGAIGAVIIEDSIAYNNGVLTDGSEGSGDKNGFKLGGEGIYVPHIIRNSIAFGNGANGFTSNSNPGVIAVNNLAFNNAGGNLEFTTYTNIETDFTLDGFVSFQTEGTEVDKYPSALEADNNFTFNGSISVNKSGIELTNVSDRLFIPNGNITRANYIFLLVNVLGLTAEADENFSDVNIEDYYYKAVGTAKELGIVKGDRKGQFHPNEKLSRQDMFVIAARILRITKAWEGTDAAPDGENEFTDAEIISAYARNDISAVIQAGLFIKNKNNKANPVSDTSLGEVGILIFKLYNFQK